MFPKVKRFLSVLLDFIVAVKPTNALTNFGLSGNAVITKKTKDKMEAEHSATRVSVTKIVFFQKLITQQVQVLISIT